jgi:predicted nucleotidyltransferase
MTKLPVHFLKRLVAELNHEPVVAIGLTGSYARGAATPFSDVDIHCFLPELPEYEEDRYQLRRMEDRLVSLTATSIRAKRDELTRPETIIWAVPGLRQMRVLLDKGGELTALKRDVLSFNWKLFQSSADAYASRELMGLAEEVHKVLGGFARNDESTMAYGTYGLVLGLARIVAVQRGLFIESENSYFQQVQNLFGAKSDWTRTFRLAAGLTSAIQGKPVGVSMRAFCALNLYTLTAQALRAIILLEHAEVIFRAIEAIEQRNFYYDQQQVTLTAASSLPGG